MRKIELELLHAVRSVLLGETSGWAKGNTIVTRGDGGSVQVFLHGNRLGVFTQDGEQGAFYHMGGRCLRSPLTQRRSCAGRPTQRCRGCGHWACPLAGERERCSWASPSWKLLSSSVVK